jgi:hypothetical protein
MDMRKDTAGLLADSMLRMDCIRLFVVGRRRGNTRELELGDMGTGIAVDIELELVVASDDSAASSLV